MDLENGTCPPGFNLSGARLKSTGPWRLPAPSSPPRVGMNTTRKSDRAQHRSKTRLRTTPTDPSHMLDFKARRYDTGEPVSIGIEGDRIVSVEPAWPQGDVNEWPFVAPGLFDL